MTLFETKLPDAFSKGMYEEKNMDLAPEHMDKCFDIIFTGTANILAHSKSMERPTAFVFDREDNMFVAGCVVQFFKNEDESNPGNWNMIWTFNENDVPDDANVIKMSNPATHTYFRGVAGEKYGIRYEDDASIIVTCVYTLEQLKKWLDENAEEGKEVMIECEGLFKARVGVEGGEKVFALEADGEIKNIIKDDAAIEK